MQIVKDFFAWLNDQLLKMVWLDDIVKWFFGHVIGLSEESEAYSFLTFFFYDVIKILILLSVLIFLSSWIQSRFTPERSKAIMARFKEIGRAHV